MKTRPRQSYFLLRSSDEPRGRRFVRLKAPSVLAWFQEAWTRYEDEGHDFFSNELRGPVYGLGALFEKSGEDGVGAPKNDSELVAILEKYIYAERDIEVEAHFVHVETDDDEIAIDYFFFDDDFLQTSDALERLPNAGRRTDRYAKFLEALAEES